jgi:hypothetical protein
METFKLYKMKVDHLTERRNSEEFTIPCKAMTTVAVHFQ